MRYLGSKNRLTKDLVPIIQSYIDDNNITHYYEPFVGGANMIDKIRCNNKFGSDIHPYLIALLKQAQFDTSVFPATISEEEYKSVRANPQNYPDWYVGLVGFCSFGGKWWGGLARNKKGDNYCARANRSLLKDFEGLKNAQFTCLDYKDVPIPKGAIVYADPPYENTTVYSLGKFDSNEFWEHMRKLSKDHIVLISEQVAPDDFEVVWEQELTRKLDVNKENNFKAIERLFKWKG